MTDSHPADAATQVRDAPTRRYFLQECAVHGEECWSCGYFNSREEATADMLLTNGHPDMRPECGSPITIVEYYAD